MASSTSTYSTRARLNHTINITKDVELPAIYYERTVSEGQPIDGYFKIDEYHTESDRNIMIPVQQVDTFEQYISGCTLHEKCLGHFCVTPRGTILLPQRLSSTLGIMSNDYAKMAESIFARDTPRQEEEYRERFRSLMLGKSGKMRGDMPAGTVDCSAREVISLCWEIPPNHIAISRMVARNMRVLRVMKDKETGLPLSYYVQDNLREGDWVVAVRPPSLWAGNVQPMKVVLWDHECFGISPSNADEFHADHDGDEIQIYFVAKDESIKQCEAWKPLTKCKFDEAVRTLPLPNSCYRVDSAKREKFFEYLGLREKFMVHSTLSIKELQDGIPLPEISKPARVKEAMANMLVERLNNPQKVFEDFYTESIRGIKDVMAQRLNQGFLGDMSRQARLAASCVKYKGYGKFEIKIASSTMIIIDPALEMIPHDTKYPLGGNPCIRAVSAICGVAQQAALDSHRVSQEVSSSLDLINNLIRGGEQSLVVFSGNVSIPCDWRYYKGGNTYAIVLNDSISRLAMKVIAAYNPTVLKAVATMNGDVKQVCRNGITVVCNYYNVKLSKLELYSLAELLCYRCGASPVPITVKEGLKDRNVRWMTTIFANHFGLLPKLQARGLTKRAVVPETITEAAVFCNFDFM